MADPVPVPNTWAPNDLAKDSGEPSAPYLVVPEETSSNPQGSDWAVRRTVADVISQARRRVRYFVSERPLQLVLGVAVISFIAGMGLRLWRGHE